MIQHTFHITENRPLSHKTFLMRLHGSETGITAPGQFVNIRIPGKYLRRPVSVCDYHEEKGEIVLLYDVVGEGTEIMSKMKSGEGLDILSGLGNGFSLPESPLKALLLGGGIGCAPLLALAKRLKEMDSTPIVILGYNTEKDSFGMEEWFSDLGIETYLATVDGSKGTKGFVTDVIREKNLSADYFYACGPTPMLRALSLNLDMPGELSLESRMGCGFGACMCCSLQTADGAKRICKDGPVFRKEELIWK